MPVTIKGFGIEVEIRVQIGPAGAAPEHVVSCQQGWYSRAKLRRSSAHFAMCQRSMCLGWSPSHRAGLLGTGAMLPCPCVPIRPCTPAPKARTRRGARVGPSTCVGPPSRAAASFFGPSRASTDLARRARVPAGSSTPLPFDARRISPQAVTAPWCADRSGTQHAPRF